MTLNCGNCRSLIPSDSIPPRSNRFSDRRLRLPALSDMTKLALRMGITAFGGPAAHIAILRHEAIARRNWLTERDFLDYLSLANLIPGPNSTELIMHVGAHQGGRRGLLAAGAAFIGPAAAITLALAYIYKRWGSSPTAEGILLGISPALMVVIAFTLVPLARATIKSQWAIGLTAALVLLYASGINELLLLLIGTLLYLVPHALRALRDRTLALAAPLLLFATGGQTSHPDAERIFLVFLKIGAVLYGSGYVLIAFLQRDIVDDRHWITQQQLLDAVAIGQVTPGPVFSTATFIGYLVGGWTGAAAATVGIFLPAFVLVWATHGIAARVRSSAALSQILDGLNLASNALLIGVLVTLVRDLDLSILNVLLATMALIGMASSRLGPTSILIAAGIVGGLWYGL
jgi:chromate transporter